MPVRLLFICVGNFKEQLLGERGAEQLHSDRQAVRVKATALGERRDPWIPYT